MKSVEYKGEAAVAVQDAAQQHSDDAKAKLVDRHEEACRCETCKMYA